MTASPRPVRPPCVIFSPLLAARTPTPRRLQLATGITTVIPSRDGRELLEAHLPSVVTQELPSRHEIVVVDNGSDDGTAAWLARRYPEVATVVSAAPLSFSRAVNRGIAAARYSRVCLLNNDKSGEHRTTADRSAWRYGSDRHA